MKLIKFGLFMLLMFVLSGCIGEQSFEQFFEKSMGKTYTNPEIIHIEEYSDQYAVVVYSFGEEPKYSIGVAKKTKNWEWIANGSINFESKWSGVNQEDFQLYNETIDLNLFYGAVVTKPNRRIFVEDQEVKQIPLNESNNLWYYIDFEGKTLDVEVYALNEEGNREIIKRKPE